MSDDYIWISRWERFQHYAPDPDRAPEWIKDYTKQLDDERYLSLTDRQRALLGDLRRSFAVTRGWLPRSTRVVSRHRHRQTFRSDLDALNDAGLIEFVSREVLEHRLEKFYTSRAPARSGRELHREGPLTPSPETGEGERESLRDNGRNPRALGTNPRAVAKSAKLERGLDAFVRRSIREGWPDASLVDELVGTYRLDEGEARALVADVRAEIDW